MSWNLQTVLRKYRPADPRDCSREQLAERLAVCEDCPLRRKHTCTASGQVVSILARRKSSACPNGLWGDHRPAALPAGSPISALRSPLILETERIAREVTIGFTAFRRPRCVERLVASIRRHYPTVKIVIADNGDQPANLPADPNLEYLTLEFDCGISAGRNAIVDRLQTPYLMLADDDLVFTAETRIADLFAVLDHDPAVGVAGGAIYDHRPYRRPLLIPWAHDLYRDSADRIAARPAADPVRMAGPVPYYRADTINNFALFRREMLRAHRWDPRLKIQEHYDYYWDVKLYGLWKVACVESVRAEHRPDRNTGFAMHRGRNEEFFAIGFKKWQFTGMDFPSFDDGVGRDTGRPNLIVMGIGHSGTSIMTRALHTLGWHAGDADREYAESESIRRINDLYLEGKPAAELSDGCREALARLPQPWAIKDPRFVQTLDLWRPHLAQYRPALVWLTRDESAVEASHSRRGERIRGGGYTTAYRTAHRRFSAWPWGKIRLEFESVLEAARLIDPEYPQRFESL